MNMQKIKVDRYDFKIEFSDYDIEKVLEILLFCKKYCADKETTDYCITLADAIINFKYGGGK